jgi:hypothetical protein
MRNVTDKCCTEKQNTHFLLNNFFLKKCAVYENGEKYSVDGQATDDNTEHVHFMQDT